MLSINEAATKNILRLRKPIWANPNDYVRIDIIDRKPGPWLHFFSPLNESLCGQRNPQDIAWPIMFGVEAGDHREFVAYEGDLDPADSNELTLEMLA